MAHTTLIILAMAVLFGTVISSPFNPDYPRNDSPRIGSPRNDSPRIGLPRDDSPRNDNDGNYRRAVGKTQLELTQSIW